MRWKKPRIGGAKRRLQTIKCEKSEHRNGE